MEIDLGGFGGGNGHFGTLPSGWRGSEMVIFEEFRCTNGQERSLACFLVGCTNQDNVSGTLFDGEFCCV